ncbi:MAG: hypothetical protein JXR07_03005 [Reichenbachiella sp.]
MIVVLADDFSGAVEVAGIAHRYGLSHEIQIELNTEVDCEIIIVNTRTRAKNEIEAVRIMEAICLELIKSKSPVKIFKKVDSTMRGHIVAELDVLQYHFDYDRIFLFPNNPSRGEQIKNGRYLINGVQLPETIFGDDPIHPAEFSYIEDIVSAKEAIFNHEHQNASNDLPNDGLISGDVEKSEDIKSYLEKIGDFDLCAGAAECFEVFLQISGFEEKRSMNKRFAYHEYILIINGSAIKNEREAELVSSSEYQLLELPSGREGNLFEIEKLNYTNWQNELLTRLKASKKIAVSIQHPISKEKKLSSLFLTWFEGLGKFIGNEMTSEKLVIGLTGAATAEAFVLSQGYSTFKVQQEMALGVVLINPVDDPEKTFIVKPGKYTWPDGFFAN